MPGDAYLSRIDGNAVILVVDFGTCDRDIGAFPDVEAIRIGGEVVRVTIRVIHRDISHGKISGAIDAEHLHRRVLDVDALDGGRGQVMGIEELGLCFTTIATLSIPPAAAIAIEHRVALPLDRDISSRNTHKRPFPFLVSKSGFSLEDHLVHLSASTIDAIGCENKT